MKKLKINEIIKIIPNLSNGDFRILRENIVKRLLTKEISNILENPIDSNSCLNCESSHVIKWGKRNDLQRFKCKSCGKTFNSLTKTPLARLRRKGHWLEYANCLKRGMTIRKSAKYCGISKNTSFRWRHRFISNLKYIKPKKLAGIIENSETFFRESFKGERMINVEPEKKARRMVSVFVGYDRNNNVYDLTDVNFSDKNVKKNILEVYDSDSLLFSENKEEYINFAKNNKFKYGTIDKIKGEKIKNDIVHINNIENYLDKFQKWIMKHFKGVATKYLENYVSWYRTLNEFSYNIYSRTLLNRAKTPDLYKYQPLKVTANVLI